MTYSVVARDPATGELGVAVQSHFFATGAVVPWARPGIGAVASQAMAELSYGPLALDRLVAGEAPADALAALLAADAAAETRQVAIVDAKGAVATHTGRRCIHAAGHRTGDGWSVQANMMADDGVPDAMAAAFERTQGELVYRLLAALDAAEAEGGDIRGRQSAAVLVVAGDPAIAPWEQLYDVRVDDHPDPLGEIRRLVEMRRAYRTGGADHAVMGDNPELRFWHALALATNGDIAGARALLDAIYAADDRWRELVRRLPGTGVLPEDDVLVARLTDR